jgi:hypothetical protein
MNILQPFPERQIKSFIENMRNPVSVGERKVLIKPGSQELPISFKIVENPFGHEHSCPKGLCQEPLSRPELGAVSRWASSGKRFGLNRLGTPDAQ